MITPWERDECDKDHVLYQTDLITCILSENISFFLKPEYVLMQYLPQQLSAAPLERRKLWERVLSLFVLNGDFFQYWCEFSCEMQMDRYKKMNLELALGLSEVTEVNSWLVSPGTGPQIPLELIPQ